MNDAAPAPPAAPPAGLRHPSSAIVSLITGVLGLSALPVLGSILALVFGSMSRREVAAAPTAYTDELGRVGRILGWIGIALALLGLVFGVLLLMAFRTGMV